MLLQDSEENVENFVYLKGQKESFKAEICHAILNEKVISRLRTPNFYYLNSFVRFVADEINRLEESPLLDPTRLKNSYPHVLEANRMKQVRQLHRDIVHHVIELALKISIVEKYLGENQVIDSQLNFIRKSEVEIQASRFEDVPWDVYKYPLIVLNDLGTVTSIYQSVDKISKPLRDFQKKIVKR